MWTRILCCVGVDVDGDQSRLLNDDGACRTSGREWGLNRDHRISQMDTSGWRDNIADIWQRDFRRLPVHADLPRLGRKTTLVNADGDVVVTHEQLEAIPTDDVVRTLVVGVAQLFDTAEVEPAGDSRAQVLQRQWDTHVGVPGGDLAPQLMHLFECEVGETSATARVLKLMHQRVIFPAYYHMKKYLSEASRRYPFKDQRGTWTIEVSALPGGGALVCHRKEQRATAISDDWGAGDDVPALVFGWELSIQLTNDLQQIAHCQIAITHVVVDDSIEEVEERALLRRLFPVGIVP